MKSRTLIGAICLLAAGSLLADPAVSLSRVAQRYPWNGLVDIDYTITDALEPYCLSLEFSMMTPQGEVVVTNALETFVGGVPPTTTGAHRITWNAAADQVSVRSDNATFRAELVNNPDAVAYLVIDVSGGPEATTYPAELRTNVESPETVFNTDEYKTTKIVLRRCPAGSFWMGATEGDEDAEAKESPRHFVKLTNPVFVGVFPVTSYQYMQVMGENPSWWTADATLMYPVNRVSQKMLLDNATYPDNFFVRLKNRVQIPGGLPVSFNLPTEAQWEYACRAGTDSILPGPLPIADYAWYKDNAKGSAQTVGQKQPNGWGLYDMLGNVTEWVQDYVGEAYPKASTVENPDVNPMYQTAGSWNAGARGGSWYHEAKDTRSSARQRSGWAGAPTYFGFRIFGTVK